MENNIEPLADPPVETAIPPSEKAIPISKEQLVESQPNSCSIAMDQVPKEVSKITEGNAAAKIQAVFRGSQARKVVKNMRTAKLGCSQSSCAGKRATNGAGSKQLEESCGCTDQLDLEEVDLEDGLQVNTKIAGLQGTEHQMGGVQVLNAQGNENRLDVGEQVALKLEEERAVVRSQALVRGKLARRKLQQLRTGLAVSPAQDKTPQLVCLSASQRLAKEKEEASVVKIQAIIRGRLARKHLAHKVDVPSLQALQLSLQGQDSGAVLTSPQAQSSISADRVQEVEDMPDHSAKVMTEDVTKIQALFRGRRVRRQLDKSPKQHEDHLADESRSDCDAHTLLTRRSNTAVIGKAEAVSPLTPQLSADLIQVTKIQAAFRGMKARKLANAMKSAT